MRRFSGLAAGVAFACLAAQAEAATLRLDGYTAPVQAVEFGASPVPGTPTRAGATAFNMTDIDAPSALGSFVAWCLDVAHWLMPVGASQSYVATTDPFSNSYGLSTVARDRLQDLFDAAYDLVDVTNGDQAAAYQMALWEAAFEDDGNPLSVSSGLFQVSSTGSTALANNYLALAESYSGHQRFRLTYLERDTEDLSASRGQNLVTVSPVPLPAAGFLMIAVLGGLGALSRRRKA